MNFWIRSCSQKPSSLEMERVYSPSGSNRRSLSQSDRCYHGVIKSAKCSCPAESSLGNNSEPTSIREGSHVFESCPVCSKYKCYFACNCEGKAAGYACKCRGNSPKVHGSPSPKKYVKYSLIHENNGTCVCRPSSAPNPREDPSTLLSVWIENIFEACDFNSWNDQSIFVVFRLKAKIKQLQKAKAKLSHICNTREDEWVCI